MSRDKNISTLLRLIRIGRLSWMTSWYDATCCRGNKFHSIERKREQSRYIRVMTSLFCVPRDWLIYLWRIFRVVFVISNFLGMKQCLIHKISVSILDWKQAVVFHQVSIFGSEHVECKGLFFGFWIRFRQDPQISFAFPPPLSLKNFRVVF